MILRGASFALLLAGALMAPTGADVPKLPAVDSSDQWSHGVDQKEGDFVTGLEQDYTNDEHVKHLVDESSSQGVSGPVVGVAVDRASGELSDEEKGRRAVRQGVCVVADEIVQEGELTPCDEVPGGDGEGERVVVSVTRSDFARLPVVAPKVHVQPDREWALVNMDTYAFVDATSQVLETEVLGVPVAVRAVPVDFVWDFGDGSEPLVTESAGGPYPEGDVVHQYDKARGDTKVGVTVRWRGEYQVMKSGPWIPIVGQIQTHSSSGSFSVVERRVSLVEADN